jgi:hypothetical protein
MPEPPMRFFTLDSVLQQFVIMQEKEWLRRLVASFRIRIGCGSKKRTCLRGEAVLERPPFVIFVPHGFGP